MRFYLSRAIRDTPGDGFLVLMDLRAPLEVRAARSSSAVHADSLSAQLLTRIKMLTGIVEVGLFCHMAKSAYFGNQDGSVTIKWHDGRIEKVDTPASPLVEKESA